MNGQVKLNTESFDESLQWQKKRFPDGVYRLREDMAHPGRDQGKGPAWYQQRLFLKGMTFLVQYRRSKDGQERLHLWPWGQEPITLLSKPALLWELLQRLQPLDAEGLELELQKEGLRRVDLLQAMHRSGYSRVQVAALVKEATGIAAARIGQRAKEKRDKERLSKLRSRDFSGPRTITRPLDAPALGLPSLPSIEVTTAAIEAVEVVDTNVKVEDADPTKPDLGPPGQSLTPRQSLTVRQLPSETLLQEIAMPKKGENG